MKIYIVGKGVVYDHSMNEGVHQVEDYAYKQADELMAVGEWSDAQHFDQDNHKVMSWFREDGEEYVFVEEWELSY